MTEESLGRQFRQMFIPFMIAGLGMVFAGVILDGIQRWDVFMRYTEVLVMVPALLGLKGNIEMTLASRLSTSANIGLFRDVVVLKETLLANIAISQLQAIVVGFFSSIIALLTNPGGIDVEKALVMMSCSVLTASVTSLMLGFFISAVIVISNRHGVNPDNVATPIAASLGDFCTLWILSRILYLLDLRSTVLIYIAILIGFLLSLPLLIIIAKKNASTAVVLRQGWTPVIIAMCISSCGGMVLKYSIQRLPHLALFQPLINGLGGNLASVYASRLSTALHQSYKFSIDPAENIGEQGQATLLYMIMAGIGHLTLSGVVILLSHTPIAFASFIIYFISGVMQVRTLLFLAEWVVPLLWSKGQDPDNAAIPYLTSVGDVLGTGLLSLGLSLRHLT